MNNTKKFTKSSLELELIRTNRCLLASDGRGCQAIRERERERERERDREREREREMIVFITECKYHCQQSKNVLPASSHIYHQFQ